MGKIVSASSRIGSNGKKEEGQTGAYGYGFIFLAITLLSTSAVRKELVQEEAERPATLPICSFKRQGKSDQSIMD
jgi:hypothetical protein